MAEPTPSAPENLKARLKESYDAIADHYNNNFTRDHDPVRLTYLAKLLDQLQSTEENKVKILELGCGAGIPGTKLLLDNPKPQIHVIGNDISTTQLELAKQNLASYEEKLKLIQGDMMELDFPGESLDAVIGFYSVIHLPREEQTVLMSRIARWLKPGGLFLANFSEEEMPVAVEKAWLKQEKGWMFWSGWGSEKSVKMVEEAGFNILVNEITEDIVDANFLWVLGKKKGGE